MKLRSIIVDDNEDVATALELLLKKFPELTVAQKFTSIIEAAKSLKKGPADILFLDIEMPGGNGFDLLELLGENAPYTIFTTAYAEYAIKAIKQGAKDYLLKPIDPDELTESVKKVLQYFDKGQKKTPEVSSVLSVNTGKAIILLNKYDVLYIKADGRYSEIFCSNDQHFTICKNIGEYERELANSSFFRIHKSFLINCKHVVKINSNDGGFVEMSNKKEIEISKRKKAEFLKFIK